MPRMLSRDRFPPGGGFHVLHPETAMKHPFVGSFSECVTFEVAFRTKNVALCATLGLPNNIAAIQMWIDEQNAKRCIASGWFSFVALDGSPTSLSDESKKNFSASVAGVVRSAKAAGAAYISMYGSQGIVASELAESRALVCAGCKLNDTTGGLGDYFVKAAADQILGILSALRDMDVKTSVDAQLGVCRACSCPMKSKVHTHLSVIQQHITPEIRSSLSTQDPICWILSESKPN